jgi:hypothetical protein
VDLFIIKRRLLAIGGLMTDVTSDTTTPTLEGPPADVSYGETNSMADREAIHSFSGGYFVEVVRT